MSSPRLKVPIALRTPVGVRRTRRLHAARFFFSTVWQTNSTSVDIERATGVRGSAFTQCGSRQPGSRAAKRRESGLLEAASACPLWVRTDRRVPTADAPTSLPWSRCASTGTHERFRILRECSARDESPLGGSPHGASSGSSSGAMPTTRSPRDRSRRSIVAARRVMTGETRAGGQV